MREYVDNWIELLKNADPAWGIPLMALGLALMFMGWHFHRIAVPFTFLLIGLIAGQLVLDSSSNGVLAGGLIGLVLAAISHLTKKYAVAVLGGLVGAFILSGYITTFKSLYLSPTITWGIAAFGFAGGTALAFVLFREMAIITTSFIGALLLVSGLNSTLPQLSPTMYHTIGTFLKDYPAFFVPLLVGGPTLIGSLIQLGGANKADAGAM